VYVIRFGRAHQPFPTIWVIGGFADWIIREDKKQDVFRAVIDNLVRLAWFEKKCIAGFDGCCSTLVSCETSSGNGAF
jgi:hypothetical protein